MAYVDSSSYSYGTSAFGSAGFGSAVLPAVSTVSASTNASCIRIISSGSLVSSNATVASIGGLVANADATVSAASTSSCDAARVREGGATPSTAATASASSTATFVASGLSSVTASTASVAEQFVLKESDKFSYGTGAYGQGVFDDADLQTIVSATSVNTTASASKLHIAAASISASSSTSSVAEKIHQGSSEIVSGCGTRAVGVFTITADATITSQSAVSVSIDRVRPSGAIASSTNVNSAIGREKWERIPYNSVNWSEIAA